MSVFIFILLINWNQALALDEAPTYQIENQAIFNSTPDGQQLGQEISELEQGMELNSEHDLKIIVDTPDSDQYDPYQTENSDNSTTEDLIQDQAQVEMSSTDKKQEEIAPPEEAPVEGTMIDGDISEEEINHFSSPTSQNQRIEVQEDSLNTSQSAIKKSKPIKKTFEFPAEKKDSSFPLMEFPKIRRNRSR